MRFEWEAVVFDLDGTLVDSRAAILRAWAKTVASTGTQTDGLAEVVLGRSADESWRILAPQADQQCRRELSTRVLRHQENDPEAAVAMDGAREIIASLARPWAIVTGCTRSLARKRLMSAGLPIPKALISDDDVTRGKPAPDGYLAAVAALNTPVEGLVAVEDAPSGVSAARSAGLRVIGIPSTDFTPRQLTDAGATITIASLVQLGGALGLPMNLPSNTHAH